MNSVSSTTAPRPNPQLMNRRVVSWMQTQNISHLFTRSSLVDESVMLQMATTQTWRSQFEWTHCKTGTACKLPCIQFGKHNAPEQQLNVRENEFANSNESVVINRVPISGPLATCCIIGTQFCQYTLVPFTDQSCTILAYMFAFVSTVMTNIFGFNSFIASTCCFAKKSSWTSGQNKHLIACHLKQTITHSANSVKSQQTNSWSIELYKCLQSYIVTMIVACSFPNVCVCWQYLNWETEGRQHLISKQSYQMCNTIVCVAIAKRKKPSCPVVPDSGTDNNIGQ